MSEVKLFQYAIILQPKENKDGEVVEEGKVLVDPKTVLVADQAQANILASREIPVEYIGQLDRVMVVVRPF